MLEKFVEKAKEWKPFGGSLSKIGLLPENLQNSLILSRRSLIPSGIISKCLFAKREILILFL
jgi:hypothetical protein